MNLIEWDKNALLALNSHHNEFWDGFMWMATDEVSWLAFIAMLLYTIYKSKGRETLLVLLLIVLTILVCDQVSGLFKDMIARARPSRELSIMDQVHIVNGYRGGRYGFFSSHAANTFGIAVFLSLVMRHRLFMVLLISWALLESYSRIYLGVHYPLDIFAGITFGSLVGWGMYKLYVFLDKRFFPSCKSNKADVRGLVLSFVLTIFMLLIGAEAISDFLL